MIPPEFRTALAALGLSQARLARLIEVDKATVNRWAMGVFPVPRVVVVMLRLWLMTPYEIKEVEAL